MKETGPTFGGTAFKEGELALVTEIRLAPAGTVLVTLRTPDGRSMIAMRPDDYVPA